MKLSLPSVLLFSLFLTACDRRPPAPSSAAAADEAARKKLEAAKRYDRQHDEAMKRATEGTIPDPKPAGPLR